MDNDLIKALVITIKRNLDSDFIESAQTASDDLYELIIKNDGLGVQLERVVMQGAMNDLIKKAKENVTKAVDRQDYSSAAKADSYLTGLQVALAVIENS